MAARNSDQILLAARARLAEPANWTTGAFARDERGEHCLPESAAARSWSSYGALAAEGSLLNGPEADALRKVASDLFGLIGPVSVEEMHGHPAVLKMYDAAIALVQAERS